MKTQVLFALLVAGATLAGCAKSTPPMAGTSAGTCDEPLVVASRANAGAGCSATATQGQPAIVGCDAGKPQVAYTGLAMGTLGNPNAQPIPPGGETASCN